MKEIRATTVAHTQVFRSNYSAIVFEVSQIRLSVSIISYRLDLLVKKLESCQYSWTLPLFLFLLLSSVRHRTTRSSFLISNLRYFSLLFGELKGGDFTCESIKALLWKERQPVLKTEFCRFGEGPPQENLRRIKWTKNLFCDIQ